MRGEGRPGAVSDRDREATQHRAWRRVDLTRLRPLSLIGAWLGVLMATLSVTPSLVPRAVAIQGLLVALCLITGYALGSFIGWAGHALELPNLSPDRRHSLWLALALVAPVILTVASWLGRQWQLDQQVLLRMPASVPWWWILSWVIGALLALLFLGVGRGVVWVGRRLARFLRRHLPGRLAAVLAVLVTALATWYVVSGVLVDNTVTAADDVFSARNDTTQPSVVNPESPYRSGGPRSEVSWQDLGRQGRTFIWQARTAADIERVTGVTTAMEPIRVFVGLESSESAAERAAIAVDELRRLGGFQRKVIAVAGTTGSGWVNPKPAAALEYVTHGDVATVATQYSYLPSWMSFLVDRERAQRNAEELITAIRVQLAEIPADRRPELYVFGESLGAYSIDSAFTSVESMSTTTDGALLIGPPSFDPVWTRMQAGREPDSPLWKPRYRDGAFARTASSDGDLADPSLHWASNRRIVFLVNPSDPITAWTADAAAWIDPRGPDVSPRMLALPIISRLQTTLDQIGANAPPPGHGHRYDETVVTAWATILGEPALPRSQVDAIRATVRTISDPG